MPTLSVLNTDERILGQIQAKEAKKIKNMLISSQMIASRSYSIFEELNFSEIENTANSFADYIETHFEEIASILLEYESFEVVCDEIERTLDHLRCLKENKEYFIRRAGPVAAFLPRNQPVYALTCFVLVPSLMASEVHFRIPHSMKGFLPRLIELLKVHSFFPNVIISKLERLKFLEDRSSIIVSPETGDAYPITDVVIFTGTSHHAEKLRLVFDQKTLFIANGSGHNPIVVGEGANIANAVEATLTLQLYNQGQDCANPNAILVHKNLHEDFLRLLCAELKKVKVGKYQDRECRVGPISDPDDLQRIQTILLENRHWINPATPGVIRTSEAIVEPTIICKPLELGGNFTEVFAPIIFVQKYSNDDELSSYFEAPQYTKNAMYISVYGHSAYIKKLINRPINGKILHDESGVFFNKHLHAHGVERGTQPYGGYGYAASSISINGVIIPKPTLPQRDIFEAVIKPFLNNDQYIQFGEFRNRANKIIKKDIYKILGIKTVAESFDKRVSLHVQKGYIDILDIIASDGQRYYEITQDKVFSLLENPNIQYFTTLKPDEINQIRLLHGHLKANLQLEVEEFTFHLYSIPKSSAATVTENKRRQLSFFKNIYQLLLGKDAGPRLAQFLMDADRSYVLRLLNF